MNKYLIQGISFDDVRICFMQNFDSAEQIVAIARCDAGSILATDNEEVVQLFRNLEGAIVTPQDDRVIEVMIRQRNLSELIGHDLAVPYLT